MRIGLDAMGGDHAPREIILGAKAGLAHLGPDDELVLFGPQEVLTAECAAAELNDPRVKHVHCPDVIAMHESPVDALRQKRKSSIVQLAVATGGADVDAAISAGNTGSFAAACQLKIGPLKGVSRPGIAITMPTFHGPVVICDVGANTTPKPHHLLEYAHICTCYSRVIYGNEAPRVGLVSIGEEEGKGNPLVKEAGQMIRRDPKLRFVGNVEGRDIFGGACEIAVCDGFVGNVILKLTEGLAEGLFKTIFQEIGQEAKEMLPHFEAVAGRIWKRHDFAEYGGAPLLGLRKAAIICHGRSDKRAIGNAVRLAAEQVRQNMTGVIAAALEHLPGEAA